MAVSPPGISPRNWQASNTTIPCRTGATALAVSGMHAATTRARSGIFIVGSAENVFGYRKGSALEFIIRQAGIRFYIQTAEEKLKIDDRSALGCGPSVLAVGKTKFPTRDSLGAHF